MLSSEMIFRELDYRSPGSDPLLGSAAQLVLSEIYNDNSDTAHLIDPVDLLSRIIPPASRNYCLEANSRVVAVGSLDENSVLESTVLINRVAVDKQLRYQGLGRMIMSKLEATALALGKPNINLVAQDEVVGFFNRLGYRNLSEHPLHSNILTKNLLEVG